MCGSSFLFARTHFKAYSPHMTGYEDPIFGENGAIKNPDRMQPQDQWLAPEPQGLSRKHWVFIIAFVAVIVAAQTLIFTL